jgi:hypothetical protein
VKPSFTLEVEISGTEPFSLVYFVEAVVTLFLFFLIIEYVFFFIKLLLQFKTLPNKN